MWLFIVLVIIVHDVAGGNLTKIDQGNTGTTNRGRHFVIACVRGGGFMTQTDTKPCAGVVLATYENAVKITVASPKHTTPFISNKTVTRFKDTTFEVGTEYRFYDTGKFPAITLDGDGLFTVTVASYDTADSLDTYLAFPVRDWGTKYFVMTLRAGSLFVLLSAHAETQVVTKMKQTVPPGRTETLDVTYEGTRIKGGTSFTVTLDKYEAFQFQMCDEDTKNFRIDLTGSKSESDKPFGMLTGCCLCGSLKTPKCGSLNETLTAAGSKDMAVEMLRSSKNIGMDYILFSIPDRETVNTVSAVAWKDDTVFKLYKEDNDFTIIRLNKAGDFWKEQLQLLPTTISSTQPISVALQMESSCGIADGLPSEDGDSSLSIVIPTALFFDSYLLGTPKDLDDDLKKSFAITIIKSEDVDGLMLNGKKAPSDHSSPVPGSKFVQLNILLPTGRVLHDFFHNRARHFGCYIYAVAENCSYLHPAGYINSPIADPCGKTIDEMVQGDLINNDCDENIDEEEKNQIDDDKDGLTDEDLGRPPRQDGKWSDWISWQCSSSCGVSGKKSRSRKCDSPERLSDGINCLGEAEINSDEDCDPEYKICREDCPPKTWDFGCKEKCSPTCVGDCNKITGHCSQCMAGNVLGDDFLCDKSCPAYTFGVNCTGDCKKKCRGNDCVVRKTGLCTTGASVSKAKSTGGFSVTLLVLSAIAFGIFLCILLFCCSKKKEAVRHSEDQVVALQAEARDSYDVRSTSIY